MKIKYLLILILIMICQAAYAKECVPAADFGKGGNFFIPANPDVGGSKKSSNLLIYDPPYNQVARWIPTDLSTTGIALNQDATNEGESVLKIYISNAWSPWGGDVDSIQDVCTLEDCDYSKEGCLEGGKQIKITPEGEIYPCKLQEGMGLYGLISVDFNNTRLNPNNEDYATNLPADYFRTFHLWPLKSDSDGQYFEMRFSQQCDKDIPGNTICLKDTDEKNREVILKGSLYLKILDTHYWNNTGGYEVTIVSGVYKPKGFIQRAVEAFSDTMQGVASSLYNNIISNLNFFNMAKAILLLYVCVTALLFMLGLTQIHQGDLIIRFIKVALIVILITPSISWDFFNEYLFRFFITGGSGIATIITESAFKYSAQFGIGQYILPENASSVSVFDNIIDMLKAPAIHKKIAALLFYKWYFVYIVFLYASIVIIFMAVVRSVMLYITSIMIITLLMIIAPIFLLMILFKITREYFDLWLKQLLANAVLMIVIAASIAIMVNLLLNQLESLLYYRACWDIVYPVKILSRTIFNIWFWTPTDHAQINAALTPENFFSFFLVCLLFNTFMQEIPQLVDALSDAALRPISHFYGGAVAKFQNSLIYKLPMTGVSTVVNFITPISLATRLPLVGDKIETAIKGGQKLYDQGERLFDKVSGTTPDQGPSTYFLGKKTSREIGDKIDNAVHEIKPKSTGIFE